MRALVTGAAGFIGSHVARHLVREGHDVLVLVLPTTNLWRLSDILCSMKVSTADLNEVASYESVLSAWQPEVCFHLAWYTEPGVYLHSTENISSLNASVSLLQRLIKIGCRKFVVAGTCAEYDTERGYLRE